MLYLAWLAQSVFLHHAGIVVPINALPIPGMMRPEHSDCPPSPSHRQRYAMFGRLPSPRVTLRGHPPWHVNFSQGATSRNKKCIPVPLSSSLNLMIHPCWPR
eukprot:4550963-Amphidinium_carterae.2